MPKQRTIKEILETGPSTFGPDEVTPLMNVLREALDILGACSEAEDSEQELLAIQRGEALLERCERGDDG